eukprot:TRINITY_DN1149_c0_g1_i4.p2 TRINITY_DN1149_c0_g1~~TRINITY_DN1149_c0_g1_i4.p2  ORF type:complete len:239 (-),score=28.12 TRINITY_DN1149_c0_g1_i4:259-975(-)
MSTARFAQSLVRRVSCQLAARGMAGNLMGVRACASASVAQVDVDMRRTVQPLLGNYPLISAETYVAPSATVVGQVELYDKVVVWYNAVIRGDLNTVTIGAFSHICDGAVVLSDKHLVPGFDASTHLGSNVRIGARAYVKGCTIMDNATIGEGAVVLEGALVEQGAVVQPGSVVPEGARIPTNEVWGGNPVAFERKLDYKELDNPVYAARELWDLAVDHQDEFLPIGQAYQSVANAEGL